jgi:predicted nucleotidyltransferase
VTVFEPILAALTNSGVRFVVVGGVATVLHGHPRFTADLDVALDLTADSPGRAIDALTDLGLVPSLPVPARDFADPDKRAEWVGTRQLMVFSLIDPDDPFRRVDLFAEDPIPFDELWARSKVVTLGTMSVRIASIDDLIAMKRAAGRSQDLADVEALERIRDRQP